MRVIIAGSRSIHDYALIEKAVKDSDFDISCVLCGCAAGIDRLGERWALKNKIPVVHYPADWKKHGRAAGLYRNEKMAREADALILVWDGSSRGSMHMRNVAQAAGLRFYIYIPPVVESSDYPEV